MNSEDVTLTIDDEGQEEYKDDEGKDAVNPFERDIPCAFVEKGFKKGYLCQEYKMFGLIKRWKKRYFRLKENALFGFKTIDSSHPKYIYRFLPTTHIEVDSQDTFTISGVEVSVLNGPYTPLTTPRVLRAEHDRLLCSDWVASIRRRVDILKQRDCSEPQSESSEMSQASQVAPEREDSPDDVVSNVQQTAHQRFMKNYLMLNAIGEGSFSVVRKAVDKTTGCVYAVKCTKASREIRLEGELLRKLSHPYIVNARGLGLYECDQDAFLVMDYMKTDLCEELLREKSFSEDRVKKIISKVAAGIDYLHTHRIIHRDIKPENILLDGEYVKIADFGLSYELSVKKQQDTIHGSACGTPEYSAPEILSHGTYGKKSDVFSLGIVMYVMLFGTFPFSMKNGGFQQNRTDVRNFLCMHTALHSGRISDSARDLLTNMLQVDPTHRFSIDEVLRHEWIEIEPMEEAEIKEEERVRIVLQQGIEILLQHGLPVVKHGKKGSPHTSTLSVSDGKLKWTGRGSVAQPTQGKREILLSDILEIVDGFPEYPQKDAKCCFTVISQYRALNIEMESNISCEALKTGLCNLLAKEKAKNIDR